ncbi:hypothetical protein EC968_002483 [Mortierella alpina]|nr:hypothetical protein EC968_002483 [Mortierella alpina]
MACLKTAMTSQEVHVAYKIKATFGVACLCLHVDGGSSEEKGHAAIKRSKTRADDQSVLEKALKKMHEKSERGKWICTTMMEVISRILASC